MAGNAVAPRRNRDTLKAAGPQIRLTATPGVLARTSRDGGRPRRRSPIATRIRELLAARPTRMPARTTRWIRRAGAGGGGGAVLELLAADQRVPAGGADGGTRRDCVHPTDHHRSRAAGAVGIHPPREAGGRGGGYQRPDRPLLASACWTRWRPGIGPTLIVIPDGEASKSPVAGEAASSWRRPAGSGQHGLRPGRWRSRRPGGSWRRRIAALTWCNCPRRRWRRTAASVARSASTSRGQESGRRFPQPRAVISDGTPWRPCRPPRCAPVGRGRQTRLRFRREMFAFLEERGRSRPTRPRLILVARNCQIKAEVVHWTPTSRVCARC